jgi:dienelactone hydrolase
MMPRYRASLLLLMGEADTQWPRSGICLEARRDQESGASIEWHVYPATTHCWDRKQLDGKSKSMSAATMSSIGFNSR